MRRFLFLTAALGALAACGREPTAPPPPKPVGSCLIEVASGTVDGVKWVLWARYDICPDTSNWRRP